MKVKVEKTDRRHFWIIWRGRFAFTAKAGPLAGKVLPPYLDVALGRYLLRFWFGRPPARADSAALISRAAPPAKF